MFRSVFFKNYLKELTNKQVFPLGEPCFRYKIKNGKEFIAIFYTYRQHGLHVVIKEIVLTSDTNKVNWVVSTLNPEALTYEIVDKNKALKLWGNRMVEEEKINNVKHNMSSTTGLISNLIVQNLKAEQIYASPEAIQSTVESFRELEPYVNLKETRKLENVLYLSRINYLTIEEKRQLLEFNFKWVENSFPPNDNYNKYTMPNNLRNITASRTIVDNNSPI